MTPYLWCPHGVRAITEALFFTAYTGLLFLIILRGRRLRRLGPIFLPALLLFIVGFDLVCLMAGQRSDQQNLPLDLIARWAGDLPWLMHVVLLLTAGFVSVIGIGREKRAVESGITPGSIREALDNLPIGLCFSDQNGTPVLTNRSMYLLAEEATGLFFRNADELWQIISKMEEKNGIERLESGDAPVLSFSDGSVRQFSRTSLTLQNKKYVQTRASEITRLYSLSQELAGRNAALDAQHKRLSSLLERIVQTAREEEILASKVKIHKELGECLLTTRINLLGEALNRDLSATIVRWREVMQFMEITLKEKDRPFDYGMQELMETAGALGCEIIFKGERSDEAGRYPVLKSAIREAMTNAIRHAGASQLTVQIERHSKTVYALLRDNGAKSVSFISEGSGLSVLRHKIEQAGGTLEIRCPGGVELHIELPAQEVFV